MDVEDKEIEKMRRLTGSLEAAPVTPVAPLGLLVGRARDGSVLEPLRLDVDAAEAVRRSDVDVDGAAAGPGSPASAATGGGSFNRARQRA